MGQHFLASREYLARITAAVAPRPGETVVEIGPGKGALTIPLAAKADRVIAIEKDAALASALAGAVPDNVEIVTGDALHFDYRALRGRTDGPGLKVAGNLPYSISSLLIFLILDDPATFRECVFLVQKEVAERITSGPGGRSYAPISILVQINYEARMLFRIPPGAFVPPPKVDSALISLVRRRAPLFDVHDEGGFRLFLKRSFAERRKKLWNNLARAFRPEALARAFDEAGVDRGARPERVPIAEFVVLFRALTASSAPGSAGRAGPP